MRASNLLSSLILIFAALAFAPERANADCTTPAPTRVPGTIENFSGVYRVCTGTVWETIDTAATSETCTTANNIEYDSTVKKHKICKNSVFNTTACKVTDSYVGNCSALSEQKFQASDGAANHFFGYSSSISGNILAVGAYGDATDKGAVYLYKRVANAWSYDTKITGSDSATGDKFGTSVSVRGNTLVVGAPYHNGSRGAAYVWVVDGAGIWTQQQKLLQGDVVAGDLFGMSVDVAGDRLVVGASAKEAAYVFTRSGTVWTQQQKLVAATPGAGDLFGKSVAISGTSVVVGAPFNDVGVAADRGSAHVFFYSGSSWTEQQELLASDGAASAKYGDSVDIDGDSVVVGASAAEGAYYYTRAGSTWTQRVKLVAADTMAGDLFGTSVALSSGYIVVGAPINGNGVVYLYSGSGASWTEFAQFIASDGVAGDKFGQSVSIYDGLLAIGASGDDTNRGSVYLKTTIFQKQKLFPSAANDSTYLPGDSIGMFSLAVDGNYMVIGAPMNDMGATLNVGAAYVYQKTNGVWTFMTKLVPGTRTAAAWFGNAVAISGDIIVVGEPNITTATGRIYAFHRVGAAWNAYASNPIAPPVPQTNSSFGDRLSLSGTTLAVGAALYDVAGRANEGEVYVYTYAPSTWTLRKTFNRPVTLASGLFGSSIALDGTRLAVGSKGLGAAVPGRAWVFTGSGATWDAGVELVRTDGSSANGDAYGQGIGISGTTAAVSRKDAVHVYLFDGVSTWNHQAKLTKPSIGTAAWYGYTLAMKGDKIVVGAGDEIHTDTTTDGAAYVYTRMGSSWLEGSKLYASDTTKNNNFSYGLAISDDETFAAAPYTDTGNEPGVYVFGTASSGAILSGNCRYTKAVASYTGSAQTAVASFSVASVAVAAKQTVLACVSSFTETITSATWNGNTMHLDGSATGTTQKVYLFSYRSAGAEQAT